MMPEQFAAFARAHTAVAPVPFVPELRLHQAAEPMGLWELTEGEYRSEQPPPFWAFAWAGARVLAGDPDRPFLRREWFTELAAYDVPVTEALEGVRVRRTTIWELR